MPLPVGLRAFHHVDFRCFFGAQMVAQTGNWMQTVAQSWLVLQLTSSPFKLGLIGSLQFAPILLFSLASGALADRVQKRRLIVITQMAQGGQAFGLAALVASGHVEYWHVALLAFCSGLVNVLDQPARQSLVAEMVGRANVASAVALDSAAAVIIFLMLRTHGVPRARSGDGVLADMRTGIRYALRTPEIRLTLGLLFLVSIFVFNFTVYVPLVVRT